MLKLTETKYGSAHTNFTWTSCTATQIICPSATQSCGPNCVLCCLKPSYSTVQMKCTLVLQKLSVINLHSWFSHTAYTCILSLLVHTLCLTWLMHCTDQVYLVLTNGSPGNITPMNRKSQSQSLPIGITSAGP